MNVGSRGTFIAAGFRDVSRRTTRRAVMLIDLTCRPRAVRELQSPRVARPASGKNSLASRTTQA